MVFQGAIFRLTGSAVSRNSFTPLSTANGRSLTSGVITGSGVELAGRPVGGGGFMPSSREAPAKPATLEIALCGNVRREPMVSFPSAFRVCRSQAHGKPVIGLGELRPGFLTHF